MNLQLLSFKQLTTLFVSLGPHKHRELSLYASVSQDIVAQWAQGTARPDPFSERRVRHYLLSKLSDLPQLKRDHEAQQEDLKRAEAKIQQIATAWDLHLDDLHKKEAPEEAINYAKEKKAQAMSTLRKRLGLPDQ